MPSETDQNAEFSAKTGEQNTWDQLKSGLQRLSPLFADMAACARFFSRLPLSSVNVHDNPAAAPDFKRISRAAPLAGAFVALPAAGVFLFLGYSHLPALATALIVVAVLALTTGALHEDGLSDSADGFFGAMSPERRLEIMRDSRIGAFGALALMVSVALRAVLLAALLNRFSVADAAVLFLTSEAVSRALIVWQWQSLPPARRDGLAARYGCPDKKSVKQAMLITGISLIPAVLSTTILSLALGIMLAVVTAYGIGKLAEEKIDGVTGDVLGAIQQLSSLGFLVGLLMVP